MARALEEVLAVWREAERVLTTLPSDSPERREVEFEVGRLRRLYGRLTDRTIPPTQEHIATSVQAVEQARRRIAQATDRVSANGPRRSSLAELVPESSMES